MVKSPSRCVPCAGSWHKVARTSRGRGPAHVGSNIRTQAAPGRHGRPRLRAGGRRGDRVPGSGRRERRADGHGGEGQPAAPSRGRIRRRLLLLHRTAAADQPRAAGRPAARGRAAAAAGRGGPGAGAAAAGRDGSAGRAGGHRRGRGRAGDTGERARGVPAGGGDGGGERPGLRAALATARGDRQGGVRAGARRPGGRGGDHAAADPGTGARRQRIREHLRHGRRGLRRGRPLRPGGRADAVHPLHVGGLGAGRGRRRPAQPEQRVRRGAGGRTVPVRGRPGPAAGRRPGPGGALVQPVHGLPADGAVLVHVLPEGDARGPGRCGRGRGYRGGRARGEPAEAGAQAGPEAEAGPEAGAHAGPEAQPYAGPEAEPDA